MTVFRGYVRIIKRNLNSIIMYVAIFMTMCIVIQNAMANSGMTDGFSSMKMNVAVIDRDGGVVADTLKALMERDQKVVEIEDDAQVMQEELYYGNVEYILIGGRPVWRVLPIPVPIRLITRRRRSPTCSIRSGSILQAEWSWKRPAKARWL